MEFNIDAPDSILLWYVPTNVYFLTYLNARRNNGSEWVLVDALCALPWALQNNLLPPLLGKWITLSTGSASLERNFNNHHYFSRPLRVSDGLSAPVLFSQCALASKPGHLNGCSPWETQFYPSCCISSYIAPSSVCTFLYRHGIVFKVENWRGRREKQTLSEQSPWFPCLWALLPQLSPLSSQASLSAAPWTLSIFLQG